MKKFALIALVYLLLLMGCQKSNADIFSVIENYANDLERDRGLIGMPLTEKMACNNFDYNNDGVSDVVVAFPTYMQFPLVIFDGRTLEVLFETTVMMPFLPEHTKMQIHLNEQKEVLLLFSKRYQDVAMGPKTEKIQLEKEGEREIYEAVYSINDEFIHAYKKYATEDEYVLAYTDFLADYDFFADMEFKDLAVLTEKTAVGSSRAVNGTSPAEGDWQNVYREFLMNFKVDCGDRQIDFENTLFMYINDINDCGIPEIALATNPFGNCVLAYFLNGEIKVLELPVDSMWGFTKYNSDTRQIINLQFYGHTAATFGAIRNYSVYDWTPNGYLQSTTIEREAGFSGIENDFAQEYGQAYLNSIPVSNEDFELKKAELDFLAEKAEDFPLVSRDDVNGDFTGYIEEKLGL